MAKPRGVSIEFISKFKSEYSSKYSSLTTMEACNQIIKPACSARKCAYFELYVGENDSNGKPYIGNAGVFVSHAWKYLLEEPFDVMEQFARDSPNVYFWFDLFINNQCIASTLPMEWWKTTFRDSIKSIGVVLLVMSPWNNPVPITRAWCLWEIMCALGQSGVKFHLRLPTKQRADLKDGVRKNGKSILQALADIQAEKAEAFKSSDRDMIFRAIEESIGFDEVNIRVKDQLRAWYLKTLHEVGDEEAQKQTREAATLLYNIGYALKQFNLYDDAMKFYGQALKIRLAVLGPKHVEVGNIYNNMGVVLKNQEKYDQAIEYYQKDLEIAIANYGPNHTEVASTYSNMGVVYKRKGDDAKALEYFEKDLAICLAAYGPKHPDLCPTYSNLGGVYKRRGQYDKAIEFYRKDLEISIDTYGPNHPDVATTYANMASLYSAQKNYQKSAEFYEKCMKIEAATLGADSEDYAVTASNLGKMYRFTEKYDKSLEMYRKALSVYERFASNSEDIGDCYNGMARTYLACGNKGLAISSMQKAQSVYSSAGCSQDAKDAQTWLANNK